jgi:TRAP-type mannitol/chloroaromatic compound transport system substrate-binding protein
MDAPLRRRDVLVTAGLAAAAAGLGFPKPAIAQGYRQLTMVTDWPEGPGILPSARRFAQNIADATAGRISVQVTPSGAVVRPLETFDAVQAGVADMFHSHIGYFEQKSRAFHFFSGMPFGLTADELFAWVRFGEGQALLDELAGEFNIKPLLCSSTGAQMGGWFLNELASIEDLAGLRYRMPDPGAEVLRRLGAIVVLVPGAEIVQSLRSGAIDACEWLGPWLDTEIGLHEAARYYYYPSWHEPGSALTVGINRQLWDSLNANDQRLIEAAAAAEFVTSIAEFKTNNAHALDRLRLDGTVEIRKFGQDMLESFAAISRDVVAEIGAADQRSVRIHESYLGFRAAISQWSSVAEGAYLAARAT